LYRFFLKGPFFLYSRNFFCSLLFCAGGNFWSFLCRIMITCWFLSTPRSSGQLNSPFFENLVSMSEVKSKFEYAYLNYLYVYENENFLYGSGGLGLIEFWKMQKFFAYSHLTFLTWIS